MTAFIVKKANDTVYIRRCRYFFRRVISSKKIRVKFP